MPIGEDIRGNRFAVPDQPRPSVPNIPLFVKFYREAVLKGESFNNFTNAVINTGGTVGFEKAGEVMRHDRRVIWQLSARVYVAAGVTLDIAIHATSPDEAATEAMSLVRQSLGMIAQNFTDEGKLK